MSTTYILLALIVKITVIGFFTFVFLLVLKSVKRRQLRLEIAQIEAKMANCRITLRLRVKKKAKSFRSAFVGSIIKGQPLDNVLSQLTEISFETNSDFQIYMDVCKRINNLIEVGKVNKNSDASKPPTPDADKCDFLSSDLKNEIKIARLINDMVIVSKALAKQYERYNTHSSKKAKKEIQKPIDFESLLELQKVFKIKEIQDGLSAVSHVVKPAV